MAVMSAVLPANCVLLSSLPAPRCAVDTVRAAERWKPNSAERRESGACPPEET